MRKVYLDELPHKRKSIDWIKSTGFLLNFIYDSVIGEFKILDYDIDKQRINILYKDKIVNITTAQILGCKLGTVVGLFTKDFKVETNTELNDDRNLIVTNREYREKVLQNGSIKYQKWYKYKCNNCGWTEGWMTEYHLINGMKCSCCTGRTVVEGINDIPTTAPWMVKYFQGSYDEAKLYTCNSNQKIVPIYPDCGRVKDKSISINNIYHKGIGCVCSDGISYPEKFMISMLKQLNINYIYQAGKTVYDWIIKNRLYDFTIKDLSCIIETHGEQHYKESFYSYNRSLEDIKHNDKEKELLAKENNIKHYISLDCRYSKMEWIKNSIINSELPELLNFKEKDIDWLKCHEFALNNLTKEICMYKKVHPKISTKELSCIFQLSSTTILRYLKQGEKIDWCMVKDQNKYLN